MVLRQPQLNGFLNCPRHVAGRGAQLLEQLGPQPDP
jgi:hypothetical protein